jgi:glycosyltransferase involved in cell wall biosynthesis
MSHALDVVLDAADKLRDDPLVHFLFVGEGAEKDRLKEQAVSRKLRNVTFLNQQPREKLLAFYRASNISLVPLRRLDIFKKVLPSKMFELMGVASPIVCSVEGEAADLLNRAQAGLSIEPENADALIEAVKVLCHDPEQARQLGANGERFVRNYYLRSVLAEKYIDALKKITGEPAVIVGNEVLHEQ